jgi:hypothetical protein
MDVNMVYKPTNTTGGAPSCRKTVDSLRRKWWVLTTKSRDQDENMEVNYEININEPYED